MQGWAEELGWSTRRIDKQMEDSQIGPYEAPALILQRDLTRVLLDPIARSAPNTEGVVDLYRMPAYEDVASLYFYDDNWYVHDQGCRDLIRRNDPRGPGQTSFHGDVPRDVGRVEEACLVNGIPGCQLFSTPWHPAPVILYPRSPMHDIYASAAPVAWNPPKPEPLVYTTGDLICLIVLYALLFAASLACWRSEPTVAPMTALGGSWRIWSARSAADRPCASRSSGRAITSISRRSPPATLA